MGLIVCIRCQRHVRAEDTECPFCASKLPAAAAGLAAAAALALAGCGGKTHEPAPPENTSTAAPDAGVDETPTPPDDPDRGGNVQPLYGVDMP